MKQSITEKKLTPNELKKREEIIKKLKASRSSLVKRYGKDAEKVMYGRATNIAKKTAENMNKDKVREMIKKTLMSPIKEDDWKQGDDESDMAKSQLHSIENNATRLLSKIDDNEQLDAWIQAKLTKAQDYLQSVYDYLCGEEAEMSMDEKKSFPDLTGDGKVTKADILKGRGVDVTKEVEDAKDAVDTITMDVPLFIRMLEFAREDASTDIDLHDVAEKAIEINKGKETLSMQDYEDIVPTIEEPMNEDISEKYVVWIDIDGKGKKLMHTLNSKEQAKKVGQQVYNRYFDDYNTKVGMMPLSQWEKESNKLQETLSDIDTLKKYVAKYTDDVDKEIAKYKFAGFQAFSDPVKAGLRKDMDFITWVQMKHDEDQLRREKGI